MAHDTPPTLAEMILSGPEVALIERALAVVVEKSGLSADELVLAADLVGLDLLPAVYVRWEQHVRNLESSSCGLSVDGHGLLVVNIPILDVTILLMALKSRLVDLARSSEEGGEAHSDQEGELVIALITRFEGLL